MARTAMVCFGWLRRSPMARKIGDSSLRVGQLVIVMGILLGLQSTVSIGIVRPFHGSAPNWPFVPIRGSAILPPPFLEGGPCLPPVRTWCPRRMKSPAIAIAILLLTLSGCGTSKWTDTGRSATEQLLITDAMDRAVSELDLRALAGKTCYIDSAPLRKITDSEYLVSCIRQHMFASGCMVMSSKGEADYIVEVRAGAVGTDRHDVLYGVPAVNVPTVVPVSGIPSQIPEMPIVKKTDQRAVVKLSLFAFNQKTGRPIWQSGAVPEESGAKAVWVLGAGPFQRGTIFDGMEFAGDKIDVPLVDLCRDSDSHVSVADEAFFAEPKEDVAPEEKVETAVAAAGEKKTPKPKPASGEQAPAPVVPAGHTEPTTKGQPAAASAPARPVVPASKSPGKSAKPTEQRPAVSAKESPRYPSKDLAPALTSFPFESEPRLLQTPISASALSAMLLRLETSSVSAIKPVATD